MRTVAAILACGVLFAQLKPRDYSSDPRGDYETRRREFAAWAAGAANHGLYSQVARMAGGQPVDEKPIRDAIQFVNNREDTADFRVAALIRIYQLAGPKVVSVELKSAIRTTLLGFKYWCDEPGPDTLMGEWSENHQMLFHSSEYLVGQMFPDDTFPNNGRNGRWHMQHARPMVLAWINTKARAGFSEWDSNAYWPEDMASLLNLADYAQDAEIARRTTMLLHVMFFDMAVDSFRGAFGTSHGRTYEGSVVSAFGEGTTGAQWIAWGMGSPGSPDNVAAVWLATSAKYRVPRIIQQIAQDTPAELTNRERQGLTFAAARELGLRPEDPGDFFLVWDSGRISSRAEGERTQRLLKNFNFHRYEVVIKPYEDAVIGVYRALEEMGVAAEGLDRTSLERVDKITYRTPDYQLSAAQDYRKGKAGYQQHIWQATLGPEAIVFTLNPSVSHKYWVGQFPKAVQHKNLLIALYNVPSQTPPGPKTVAPPDAGGNATPSPSPAEELPAGFTEAIFRRAAFEEVLELNGWVFGRKGDGFVALRSQLPVVWSAKSVLNGEGLVAEGRKNIWICQMGRAAVDGPFREWTVAIAKADLQFDGLSVHYRAPHVGDAHVSWDDPLSIDGQVVATTGYPRFDNPYCRSEWGSGRYEIRFKGERLLLDFR